MNNLTPTEQRIAQDQSSLCDRFAVQDDLVFSYPGNLISEKNANRTAGMLQRAINYLKTITNLNPSNELNSRVIFRWIEDQDKENVSNWTSLENEDGSLNGQRIDLSWEYMFKPCEPFRICSHELVHPFYRVSPLHEKNITYAGDESWLGNEGWGEGFCEFMRGPVMNSVKLPGNQGVEWWLQVIEKAKNNEDGTHQNPAGQFVLWYFQFCESDENSISQLISDARQIKAFVGYLFKEYANRPLQTKLTPTNKMIRKYGNSKL